MVRTYGYSANFSRQVEKLFREAIFLGEGHNGIVYELPENKALKIFVDKRICKEEAAILNKVRKSKYFPDIYEINEYYILREKIEGMRLDHYIRKNGIDYNLSKNIFKLIKEFKRLKFSKLDARCRDIYVDEKGDLRVIDPKQCYTRKVAYPRHLMKGINGVDALEEFIRYIKKIDYDKGVFWEESFKSYKLKEEEEEY